MKSKAYIIRDILSDVYTSLKNKADSMNNELVKEFDLKKVKPYDLLNFLKENDIPKDATFGIEYDCDYSCPCVKYCVLKPYSDAQKKEYIKSNIAEVLKDKSITIEANFLEKIKVRLIVDPQFNKVLVKLLKIMVFFYGI